jgi:ribosomal protein L16 Arg81 hydroxylase
MFAEMLAPMSCEEFFSEYWTKRFVHLPGERVKFQHLFSWDVLSRTLEQHRFTPHRLVLFRAGRRVESNRYLAGDSLDAARLKRELAEGATLILDRCEEVHRPLRDLCVQLERFFHVSVNVNLYAGWRKDNGFDIHWDRQDTLILQVYGRKHWKVWRPTRLYPFQQDVVDTSSATSPNGPPIWDGVLEQGGMLNMPRGWWHVAYPMDEPCLHLTVTIPNLNGIDLLRWFVHRMKTSDAARMELPIVASRATQRLWLQSVWRDLSAAWNDDLLDRYLADVDARAWPRPTLQLPAIETDVCFDTHTPLELANPRPLRFQTFNGAVRFTAGGTDWQTTNDLVPALERFNDGLPHTLAEVSAGGEQGLLVLTTALLMRGVVRVAERSNFPVLKSAPSD